MNEEYINFGDELVNKLDLLKAINDYKAYSSTQPWSASRRGAFDAAVESAINRGILGTRKYTNPDTGESVYYATFGGDPFDINTFDKNTRRGYMDAASFIGRLAESLPTKKSIEEKLKKEEEEKLAKLLKFDNFENSFKNYMKQYLGGQEFNIGSNNGKEDKWNYLDDVRDENGAVGIENRTKELSKRLKEYKTNLKVEDYNWKDTPYGSSEEFLKRLDKAITALDSPGFEDDHDAIELLGLPYNLWFNNRTGEIYGYNGETPITYGQYYRGLKTQQELKAKDDAAKAEATRKAYNANLIGGLKWYSIDNFNGKLPSSENNNLNYLNELAAKNSWTGDEFSQLVGVFKLAQKNNALENLSKEELATFGQRFGSNPNRFKKINGLNGIYWDSLTNKIAKPYKQGQLNSINFLDILDKNNPNKLALNKLQEELKQRELYAKRTEMTTLDWEYLASIVPDIASIVDIEPWSAGGLALAGAGMRHHALSSRPGGMSFTDKLWQGADYLGAGLAAVPGLGDAYLIGRALNTIRKVATPLFAIAGTYGLASSTINAIGKLSRDEDLTTQEKMDIIMSIPTLISAYRLRSREGLNEAAKAANLSNVQSNKGKVKVTVTDDSGNKTSKEITGLSELKAKELLNLFKKAGNDNNKKSSILKNDSEVLLRASELGIDINKISIETDSRKLASYRKPTEIEYYQEVNPSSARARYDAEIERLKNSGKNWQARRLEIYDKFYRGTGGARSESKNNWLKRLWHGVVDTPSLEFANRIKNGESTNPSTNNSTAPKSTTETPKSTTETPKTSEQRFTPENRKAIEKYKKTMEEAKNPKHSRKTIVDGAETTINVNGTDVSFKYSKTDNSITIGGKHIKVDPKEGQAGIRKEVAKWIEEQRSISRLKARSTKVKNTFSKNHIENIRKLKKLGFLKQGGTLDETINNFLKNNNI